jgi:hypothetical protein
MGDTRIPADERMSPSGGQVAAAYPGDTAAGVILLESNDTLYLDTKPCTNHVLTFNKPYKRTKIGSIKCDDGRVVERFQVEAKKK